MNNSEYPTPDARRVRTELDKVFYGAGIPSDFWGPPKAPFRFHPYEMWNSPSVVPVHMQDAWWNKLLSSPDLLKKPHLVFVCCPQSDQVAMTASFELMKLALANKHRIQVDNAATADTKTKLIEPVACLYNVTDDCTVDRRQAVRDWIRAYQTAFRVVAISGQPGDAVMKFRVTPTFVFSINPMTMVHV